MIPIIQNKRRNILVNALAVPIGDIGIISRYTFEDNTNDVKGSNNGIPTDITYVTEGVSKMGNFNGTTSKVNIPTKILDNLDGFSISVLCKMSNTSLEYRVISLDDNSTCPYISFRLNQAGFANRIYVFVYGVNKSIQLISSGYIITDLTHITLTVKKNGNCKLYVNGNLEDTDIITTFRSLGDTLQNHIGVSRAANYNFTNGLIDEVIFWNKELTQEDITKIATDQLNGIDIDP